MLVVGGVRQAPAGAPATRTSRGCRTPWLTPVMLTSTPTTLGSLGTTTPRVERCDAADLDLALGAARPAVLPERRFAGIEDTAGTGRFEPSAHGLGVCARREPPEHVDHDVGGGAGCRRQPDRELTVAAGTQDRRVGDDLVGLEVDQRRHPCRRLALAERLEVARCGGVHNGDVDGHRQHVVVGAVAVGRLERREPSLADDRHVEHGVSTGRCERLAARGSDVEGGVTGVQHSLRGEAWYSPPAPSAGSAASIVRPPPGPTTDAATATIAIIDVVMAARVRSRALSAAAHGEGS